MNVDGLNDAAVVLAKALWSASWQGAVVIGVVWGLCRVVPRISPSARAWLWRLVFLKVVIGLVWFAPIELPLIAPRVATPSIEELHRGHGGGGTERTEGTLGEGSEGQVLASGFEGAAIGAKEVEQNRVQVAVGTFGFAFYVAVVWAVGVCVGVVVLGAQFQRARKLRRTARVCPDANLVRVLEVQAWSFGLRRAPRLLVSAVITRPLLIGIWRPAIVLPEDIVKSETAEKLRMMLAHELGHARRHDLGWTLFAAVGRILFFFHPLIWLAEREHALAQEVACDELAIGETPRVGAEIQRYAEMLVELVAARKGFAPAQFTLGVADRKRTLERRIKDMRFVGERRGVVVRAVTVAVAVVMVVTFVPVRVVEAESPVKEVDEPTPAPRFETRVNRVEAGPLKGGGLRENRKISEELLKELQGKSKEELRAMLPTIWSDATLERMLEQEATLEQEVAAMSVNFHDKHPEMVAMRERMKTLDRQIENRISGIRAGLVALVERKELNSGNEVVSEQSETKPNTPIGGERLERVVDGRFRTYRANDPVVVHARRGGVVEKVLIKRGDEVKAGQIILQMDDSEAGVQVDTADARMRVAEAEVEIARAELAKLEEDYKGTTAMIERGVVGRGVLPNVERGKAMLKKAEAMLQIAHSERRQAEIEKNRYTIVAPVDGVILSVVAPGTWVPADGGKMLAEISNPERERAARERTVQQLEHEIADLESRRENLLTRYTQGHTEVLGLNDQIAELRRRLKLEGEAVKGNRQ